MSVIAIDIDGLNVSYTTKRILTSIYLKIESGRNYGLIGPNGAGKSTMMKILTCYIPQTSGLATVCGFDVANETLNVMTAVSLPQAGSSRM